MTSADPSPVQQRRTRGELVDGLPPRANWPAPDRSTYFTKDRQGREAEERYLAMRGALDDYIDGKSEQDIIRARPLAKLRRGQLYRSLSRALELNPGSGAICGYWVCVTGWTPQVGLVDPSQSPHGKDLRKFFDAHPDIEAALSLFCFPGAGGKAEVPQNHLTARKVHDEFLRLCRARGLHEATPKEWPYVRRAFDPQTKKSSICESTTVGGEAVRRWWRKKCFLNPSDAAFRTLSPEQAALFKRDHDRVRNPSTPVRRDFQLFERWELDESKLDAMWTMLLPMLNGKVQEVHTTRLWGLSLVDCSVMLRLSSCVSYFRRYRTQDIKRLLYRGLIPPGRHELSWDDPEYRYVVGAAYGLELETFKGSTCKHLCLDNDSTHIADDVRTTIEDVMRCCVVNGRVGVPEKNSFVEQLFGHWSQAMKKLPSATGSSIDDPARQEDAAKAAVRHRIGWTLSEEILDVLCRNWNVTPKLALGGVSPLQAAQDLWQRGRVFRSGFGQFEAPRLFRFLPKNPGTKRPQVGVLRSGNPLSPLVVRHGDAVYTSLQLCTHRDIYHGTNRNVDIYVQEDARFAVVVPEAYPDRCIPVAIAGRLAAVPHTIEMRLLTNRFAKMATAQSRAASPDVMAGLVGALAASASKDKAFQHFKANLLSFMERAGCGDLLYIDLTAEQRERLLAEARDIMRGEGYDPDDDDAAEATDSESSSPPGRTPPSKPSNPAPGDDFGLVNRGGF